jgi:hypothetical protein
MSLFQRPLQPPAILSDEAVERYLAAVRAEISVDPLFRRRLRGSIVNRFVAEREGRLAPRARRRMGGLGRAVLYASFALTVSVSSAMAASQGAAPGDALYPLKLQIEHLRLQALPEHLHDDLAAHSLGERIHELGVLAERGDWDRVATQAAAVEDEYRHYLDASRADGSSDRYLLVLTALLERLPERAQLAIEDVLDRVEGSSDGAGPGGARGQGRGFIPANDDRGSGGSTEIEPEATEPTSVEPTTVEPTPGPSRPERPDPTPRASKSPQPSAEPAVTSPTDAPGADATPDADAGADADADNDG